MIRTLLNAIRFVSAGRLAFAKDPRPGSCGPAVSSPSGGPRHQVPDRRHHPVTNAGLSNHASAFIGQIKPPTKHGRADSLLHCPVAGKNGIAVTRHPAPETDRDLVVLVTRFKESAARFQVTARQKNHAALKAVGARIIALNRPSIVGRP